MYRAARIVASGNGLQINCLRITRKRRKKKIALDFAFRAFRVFRRLIRNLEFGIWNLLITVLRRAASFVFLFDQAAVARDFRFVALIFFDVFLDRFLGEIDRVFLDLTRHKIVVRIALVFIEKIDQLVAFGDAGFRSQVCVCRVAAARSV